MPLANLGELLIYAIKKEAEKQLYPIWLVHFLISSLPGNENADLVPFEQLINATTQKIPVNNKSGEDILADFNKVVAADKEQREG